MPQPLTTLDGVVAALPFANVDTDQILPAQFMKTTSRKGLGKHLFDALRTNITGAKRTDFVLNRTPWDEARFLVALDNFGCGSSREHAPWALLDFGIRCVIAPSFADIFSNNCLKNGILPLRLPRPLCDELISDAQDAATARIRLDLTAQKLTRHRGDIIHFDIESDHKHRLVEGLDDIATSLRLGEAISRHDGRVSYPRPVVPLDIGNVKIPFSPRRYVVRALSD